MVIRDGDPTTDILPDFEQEQSLQNATLSLQERNLVQPPSNVLTLDLKTVDLSFGLYLSTLPKPHCCAFETR